MYVAIHEILKNLNINAYVDPVHVQDTGIILEYKNWSHKYHVEIKKEIREYQLNHILGLAKGIIPLLVIAENLFPRTRAFLRENGISYVDMNGNVSIETGDIPILVEGRRENLVHPEKYGRAFTKSGLKVLYLFLTNEHDINDTYREIAGSAGVAIGNIRLILQGLIEEGFALKLNDKELKLTDKKGLLDKWVSAFIEKLRPALHLGNFRFAHPDEFSNWMKINLNSTGSQWGGEAAGNIFTDYLYPEILTIYTSANRTKNTLKKAELIKEYNLLTDPHGNIHVYEKFWKDGQDFKNTVPPIIAYADLLVSANRRCIETAQKIYEKFIESTLHLNTTLFQNRS